MSICSKDHGIAAGHGNLLVSFRSVIALLFVTAPIALQADSLEVAVSANRIEDIPLLKLDKNSFPVVDNFAWRAFIALNWPSLTDVNNRGAADPTKMLGEPGPRVWETFKTRYELFPVGSDGSPVAPQPWNTYGAVNPCGAGINAGEKTIASFEAFMDFNQTIAPGVPVNPLVAQNHTYTRYETHVNEIGYTTLGRFSLGENMPDQNNPLHMPAGAIAVKAAWRVLTEADTAAIRARYYIVENANIVDTDKTLATRGVVCSKRDIALVGLHMVIRTPHRPQGIWSSFEHIDNVPPAGSGEAREPDARDADAPYSYFDASKPKPTTSIWPKLGSPDALAVNLDNPPNKNPTPMQVTRQYPINSSTMEVNRAYWALPEIKTTVWKNYMLVANQWPTFTRIVDPSNDGIYYPDARGENLVNTTMETYVQASPSSCMSCHRAFNESGRDFVGMLGSFR